MKRNEVFLATTAIEDFWDASRHVVFLSSGCKRYSRKMFWEGIDSETMTSYDSGKDGRETYRYLNTVFERLLSILHKKINLVHGTDFSARYWKIILSPWLLIYVHVIYDRYRNLKHFIDEHPDFTSICMEENSFIIPKDAMRYYCHIKNDDYNLQIYSRILNWLGYRFPVKGLKIAAPDIDFYLKGDGGAHKDILKRACELICKKFQNNGQVILKDTYLPYSSILKLVFKTKGAAWPCFYRYKELPDLPIDHEARKKLGGFVFGENEFEKMLASFVPFDMPQSIIEGFDFLRGEVKASLTPEPNAIMSGISWWYDNFFLVWAAESAEKGTKLLGVQHGGGYGVLEDFLYEAMELGIVDKFYSWGWSRDDFHAEVIPLPAAKLAGKKNKKPKPDSRVLYISTIAPRYLTEFPWSIDSWEKYFSDQSLFLSNLSEAVTDNLWIRPHREDCGWDVCDRVRDGFPRIKIESWDTPICDSLNNCAIQVSDYPMRSTTFVESLANNRPAIGFYNPDFAAMADMRDEAIDILDQLKRSSIVFEDPVTAAELLNSIHGSVEKWWNEPDRQEAVRNFLHKFGRTSSCWLREWSDEVSTVRKAGKIKRQGYKHVS